MSLEGAAVSLGATLVSMAFAALVFNQWILKRKPYQFAWGLGLLVYGVAAFTQFLAESSAWTADVYRVYYLLAAPLVAVLGVGSTFLVSRRLGYAFSVYTAVLFIGFAWVVLTSPVNTAAFAAQAIPGGSGFSDSVRIWSPLFTVPGSIALIGIAAHSYWRTRLAFNAWIAVGAIIVAAGGSLARFGLPWALYLGEFAGVALMFWGFLASQDLAKAPRPTAPKAASL
ncbi:MAG TPA: hypothetical protein VJ397_03205 [Thermoplasmata archaeon]|nr:hypothetical protein [Thermoplasmata archaeon]